ncbi:NAD(P)H-binding protein [Helicobacter saguini]|uniref:NAD(P)-dependent oxidoreductase n=1 Tax=Helicobacter saguini TaxID=1548018 RepID=A0A347VP06_9HELI|nr:NAD(P)H-binding protein [Helicobacter saguini]MWV61559.1 NAD(P)H-binding protein [Helicobacter saguini]MWV67771.1 NAD(P)H-binding protein [Helicobacter saguini]MWV70761.1 NAD(P)H-binding protein [Helicobacter saguini]MWV72665.1 NAD(P)H-binding protein [Helicobacter saguini]TLD94531.1 NAD(P)-dependent oxidoreductase [Helicobacter saguini]
MKIAVLGANGKSGSCATQEALSRNLDVTAFVRKDSSNVPSGAKVIKKDIFELKSSDLDSFDVIIDAFAEWQNLPLHLKHIKHLSEIFNEFKSQKKNKKLIVIGGAGSLYMDKAHSTRLMDTKDFPKEYLGVAKATAEVLDFLRTQDFRWTYISPAALYVFDLPRSGSYILGGEEFITNAKGESKIGYKDLAILVLDIAQNGGHDRERITCVEK